MKSIEQQGLQSIQRSRELLVQDRTSISNHIRGLLMEFGVVISQGWAALETHIPRVLEDVENGVPHMYRPALQRMFTRYHQLKEDIAFLNAQIKQITKQNDACKRLMDLEGVSPISAILLFSTLGTGEAFQNGREFSAYVGLTPKQYSSGGKTNQSGH